MHRILFVFLSCTLMLISSISYAVKLSSLYEAEIPVPAQTEDMKEKAIKEGLAQVLLKLSGDPQVVNNNPTLQANLQRADYYVQEFSYDLSTTAASQYNIRIRFNSDDIKRLLKKAQVAYWGESRPLILVWLVVTDPKHGSDLVGSENDSEVYKLIQAQSKRFGLPVIFPVMDVTDISQVSANDIASMSIGILQAAGNRYEPDALLIGNVETDENMLQSQWQLVLKNERFSWSLSDKNPRAVIATIMNQVSQTLAKHYVVNPAAENELWVTLEVSNIKQRADLAKLMEYFQELVPVQKIELSEVKGDMVTLTILIRGMIQRFQANAALNHHLSLKSIDVSANKIVYEWVN